MGGGQRCHHHPPLCGTVGMLAPLRDIIDSEWWKCSTVRKAHRRARVVAERMRSTPNHAARRKGVRAISSRQMETDCLLARLGVRLRITFMGRDPYFFPSHFSFFPRNPSLLPLPSDSNTLFCERISDSKIGFRRFRRIEIGLFDICEIDGSYGEQNSRITIPVAGLLPKFHLPGFTSFKFLLIKK